LSLATCALSPMDESTTRRRGRPAKPRHDEPPRKVGRPPGSVKSLAADPWRYLYALTEAMIHQNRAFDGPSEQRTCESFAALAVGRPAKVGEVIVGPEVSVAVTEDFLDRCQHGLPFYVVHRKWDTTPDPYRDMEPGASWRDKSKIRATADDMRRRLRLWRNAPAENPNRRWLARMAEVIKICLAGNEKDAWLAECLAADISERRYFEAKLRPLLAEQAALFRTGIEIADIAPQRWLDLIFFAE
jgi:hypothetical protein